MKKLTCKACEEEKSAASFNTCKTSPTGFAYYCRKCSQEKQREHYHKKAKKGRVKRVPREKSCSACNRVLPAEAFKPYKWASTGLTSACRECISIRIITRKYNITEHEYRRLLDKQDNKCAICGQPPSKRQLSVDHNHETNEVRGLLCDNCNLGLGNFQDDPILLKKAIGYINASP